MPVQYTKKGDFRVYNAISEFKEKVAGALVWLLQFFVGTSMFEMFDVDEMSKLGIAVCQNTDISDVSCYKRQL